MSFDIYEQNSGVAPEDYPDVHPHVLAAVARRAKAAGLSTELDGLKEDLRYFQQRGFPSLTRSALANTIEYSSLDEG